MPTARARKSKITEQVTNNLLSALKFISLVPHEHCTIQNNFVYASDGVLTAGHPITDDLQACPQTDRLLAALTRCNDSVAITQLDAGKLSVKSGPLRVTVPCIEPLPLSDPDPQVMSLSEPFLEALRCVAPLADEDGLNVARASVYCSGQNVASTDGYLLIECWHGIDMPPAWLMPKRSVSKLLSAQIKLTGFGYTVGRSATFWFKNGAWLKTQLYEDKYPNYRKIFDIPSVTLVPTPEGLFKALDNLAPFTERVQFGDGKLIAIDGAEYDVPELKAGEVYILKQLKTVKNIFERYDSTSADNVTLFFGGNARGAIAKIRKASDTPGV